MSSKRMLVEESPSNHLKTLCWLFFRTTGKFGPESGPCTHTTASVNGCRAPGQSVRIPGVSFPTSAGDSVKKVGGIGTLLKEEEEEEEATPLVGTLPLTVSPPSTLEVKRAPLGRRCRDALWMCVVRTMTRKWRLEKFAQVQRELPFSSVIENIGRLMHPVEIVLNMHSR